MSQYAKSGCCECIGLSVEFFLSKSTFSVWQKHKMVGCWELRAAMKFCFRKGKTAIETFEMLKTDLETMP